MSGAAVVGPRMALAPRADLKIVPSCDDGGAWLVGDTVASRYFELGGEEYFLFRLLETSATPEEICRRYDEAFAPRRLDLRRLERFTARLYQQGLLISDAAGQGESLRKRSRREAASRRWRALLNPLAVRLPGFYPGALLDGVEYLFGWMLTRTFALVCLVPLIAAFVILATRPTAILREIAATTDGWTTETVFLLAAVIIAAKGVHELAHAVAARRLGGECREIGVLLLIGAPCLYCDVTSIWLIPQRWRRIVVGAAGMLVEILAAACALVLWHFSLPGAFHDICLQVAVVCSAATLLFNGNPLLRYDGYFILSDLVGISNLGQRADAAFRDRASAWLWGESFVDEAELPPSRRTLWACYAAAAWCYRLFIVTAVWYLLRDWLEPAGLTLVADGVWLLTFIGMAVVPGGRMIREARRAVDDGRGDSGRAKLRLGGLLLLVVAVLLWPLPYRVAAPGVVQVRDAASIYVAAGGRITAAKQVGERVRAGEMIAELVNEELAREVVKWQGERERAASAVEHLERRRIDDSTAAAELPAAREMLKTAEEQLKLKETELRRLRIVSPREGVILPPERSAQETADARANDAESPLELRVRGRFLAAGTPLCLVGDPERLELLAPVEESEIEFVSSGAEARISLPSENGEILNGEVSEVGAVRLAEAPRPLAEAGLLATRPGEDGSLLPADGRYLVRLAITTPNVRLPSGAVGHVKIDAPAQSPAARLWRFAGKTFRAQGGLSGDR